MTAFLRKLVVQDFWLKLFSLLLAGTIYVTIPLAREGLVLSRSLQESKTFANVPVQVVNLATETRAFRFSANTVEVRVRGEQRILDVLSVNEIRPEVDLIGIESAAQLRKRVEVRVPPGITVLQVNPQEIDVVIPPRPAPVP